MKLSLTIATLAILLHSAVVQPKNETISLRRGLKAGNKKGSESFVGSEIALQLNEDLDWDTGDFDWDIQAKAGYPSIAFDDTNEDCEVIFKYNFTGTLTDRKFLDVKLYMNDCVTAADASLAFTNTTSGDELDVELDIIQETISDSVHYQDLNGTAAIIGFCLRVDYNYVDGDGLTESINFYETNVTITVDLTANFTLTEISADRTSADSEAANADLAYPVEAYICLDDNSEVTNPAALAQGSFLQVCIRIEDNVTENILVEDILTFVVSQPDSTATDSETITNAVADPLTDKVCRESGICNVKTQLQSKFFADSNPSDLRVDGVAVLAFGKASLMPSSSPTVGTPAVRRLRAPIRGLLSGDDVKALMAAQQQKKNNDINTDESKAYVVSVVADSSVQRMLQDGAAQSEFGLEVGLQGINGVPVNASSDGGITAIAAAVVVSILLAGGCAFGFWFYTKRRSHKGTDTMVKKDHHTHGTGSTASIVATTYSSQRSANHRGGVRDVQVD
jgi:hypothetical protein